MWKHAYNRILRLFTSPSPTSTTSNFRVHYGNGRDNDDDNVEHRIVHKTISDVHYPLCKLNLFAFSRCRLKLIFSSLLLLFFLLFLLLLLISRQWKIQLYVNLFIEVLLCHYRCRFIKAKSQSQMKIFTKMPLLHAEPPINLCVYSWDYMRAFSFFFLG